MSPPDLEAFVRDWESAWNGHDLDRILTHYAEDVVFRSRKAIALTGNGELRGKVALRRYWTEALTRQPDLRFTVQDAFLGHDTVAIAYENRHGVRAVETLRFGTDGLGVEGSACHRPE